MSKQPKIPEFLQKHEGRTGGTYILVTDDGHWARGATLAETLANLPARSRRTMKAPGILLRWQADLDWQEHIRKFPDAKCPHSGEPYGTDRRPYADSCGAICYFSGVEENLTHDGSIRHRVPDYLHRPGAFQS